MTLKIDTYQIRKKLKRKINVFKTINIINEIDKKIALVGNDYETLFIESKISRKENYWGRVDLYNSGNGKKITDFLYENIKDFVVVISEEKLLRKYEGQLIEIGFGLDQIISVEYEGLAGRLNSYDALVGYTTKSNNGMDGYTIFGEVDESIANAFTVLTLGGSTTDPSTGNIISWSEFLYKDLVKINKNVRVVCAGVNSQVVSQELMKLIRDGYLFNPDIVISYSGVNDFSEYYHDERNPFVLSYNRRIFKRIADRGILDSKDVLQKGIVRNIFYGVSPDRVISRGEHWVRCEKLMKSVSETYGADFIGILQPQNFNMEDDLRVITRNKYYPKAIELVKEEDQDWLLDFTDIFNDINNVFYDNCHVYEHGNRIIEKKILPYVINSMRHKGAR
ncbi:MAG: SGNH/GDSL hydrolase family protein [Lachnospiraceae bacterium]|nr:SGNH/GDSL hydrolase family protein [Lachnospiraceae bacterium]